MSIRSTVNQPEASGQHFDPLFHANYQAIYSYCVRRLGAADAEDATAEVFAVAWRRLTDMPSGEAARAWLFGVAYKVIGSRYRTRRRQSELNTRLALVRPEGVTEAEGADVEALHLALSKLSQTDQELLKLSSWDGLNRNEIAYVLGINENAVDQRLHRARQRLRERYERVQMHNGHDGKEATS